MLYCPICQLFESTRELGEDALIEVRFHGRGGQGAVTAVRILASALYIEGKYTQAIPMYGTERRGAPVVAFLRIGESRINERDLVHNPDIVVVLDPLLARTVPVTEGLKEGGLMVMNFPKPGTEAGIGGKFRLATVDATSIALETLGRPITNTAMLGAFAKASGLVSLESLEKTLLEQWPGRLGEMNLRALRAAYEKVTPPVDVSGIQALEIRQYEGILSRDVSSWRIFKPQLDEEKCIGCRRCYIYCPEVAISMFQGKARIDYSSCKGCGICSEECPIGAISMVQETF